MPFRQKIFCFSLLVFCFVACTEKEVISYRVNLSVEPAEGGVIAPNNINRLEEGEQVQLEARANGGYAFDRWEGTLNENTNPLTLTGTQDYTLTAYFRPLPVLSPNVVAYDYERVDSLPVFAIENGGTKAYILDKFGNKRSTYNFDLRLGNDITLEENGNLLGIFKPQDSAPFSFGGSGGVLRELTPENEVVWGHSIVSENELAHHDLTKLPNGNILTLVWERIPLAQALTMGASTSMDLFFEKIVEIDPANNQVVWQWKSWEHLVQDQFEDRDNFGNLRTNINKIDVNYNSAQGNGDWMHANAITYDETRDLIFISVNFYHEVWVIDHSTTTAEASSSSGGNQNKGGDLVYRFGNPSTYDGIGEKFLDNVHHPNFSNDENTQMLMFSNGGTSSQSTVYEITLPTNLSLDPDVDNGPQRIWNYTHPDLFFGKISGATKLQNGNVLITEGDYGLWEITPAKLIAWKYQAESNLWRAYPTH